MTAMRSAPPNILTASRLKVTIVLSASEMLGISAPDGTPRVVLRVQLPDRTVTVDVAAKSVRKAQAAIRESGADGVALILQGALAAGDKITQAGLSAQPKAPKPSPKAVA
jgi:hypothetical protein